MSRKKSQTTSRVHNKICNSKHNSPNELNSVIEEIRKLNFVVGSLGKGRWSPFSKRERQKIKIVGFDYQTKSFSATIYGKCFKEKFL